MVAVQQIWNVVAGIGWFVLLARRVTYRRDKRNQHVLLAFVVAGTVSMALTLVLYKFYPDGLRALFEPRDITYHTLVVGVVEEGAKFLAFLLAVRAGADFKEPQDGVLQAAVVGLTFGTIENIGYINSFDSWFMWVRPVFNTPAHATYCAVWGAIFSRAIYANSVGADRGAPRNAWVGIPLMAIFHGLYNTTVSFFLPAGVLVTAIGLLIAIALYHTVVELSPYRTYPLSQAKTAVESLKRGLAFNRRSPILNRNMGLYLMNLGQYKAAAKHLRASVPRSKDPRRAQFLAACCEQTFLPSHFARRSLRIAWARLADAQRTKYLRQLDELVADRDGIRETVNAFIAGAFGTRNDRDTREIARDIKLRRIEKKYRRAGERVEHLVGGMTDEERDRLRRRLAGPTRSSRPPRPRTA